MCYNGRFSVCVKPQDMNVSMIKSTYIKSPVRNAINHQSPIFTKFSQYFKLHFNKVWPYFHHNSLIFIEVISSVSGADAIFLIS